MYLIGLPVGLTGMRRLTGVSTGITFVVAVVVIDVRRVCDNYLTIGALTGVTLLVSAPVRACMRRNSFCSALITGAVTAVCVLMTRSGDKLKGTVGTMCTGGIRIPTWL